MKTEPPAVPATPAAPAAAAPAAPATPATPATPADGTLASAAAAQPAAPATPAAPAAPATPAAAPAAAAVPEKYDLKLPENAVLDASVLERTAATARELGLSNEHAQKLLETVNQEAATSRQAAVDAALAAHQPGGAEWVKQETAWRDAVLQDPELGNGKPEGVAQAIEESKKVLSKFGSPELGQFLGKSGLGSEPSVLKLLSKIGKAMGEAKIVNAPPSPAEDSSEEGRARRMFPSMAPKA